MLPSRLLPPSLRAGRREIGFRECVRVRGPGGLAYAPPRPLSVRGCMGLFLWRQGQDPELWPQPESGAILHLVAALAACHCAWGSSPCSAEAVGLEGSIASVRFAADGQPLGALRGRATSG